MRNVKPKSSLSKFAHLVCYDSEQGEGRINPIIHPTRILAVMEGMNVLSSISKPVQSPRNSHAINCTNAKIFCANITEYAQRIPNSNPSSDQTNWPMPLLQQLRQFIIVDFKQDRLKEDIKVEAQVTVAV